MFHVPDNFATEWQEPCPYCGAKAGERCVRANGKPVAQFPHGLRRHLAAMNGRAPGTFVPPEARSQIRRWQETEVPAARQMPEAARRNDVVTEHATQMSGGGMHVRAEGSDIERVYPLAEWIEHQHRDRGKVWRRTVIVVSDWEEVPRAET